MPDLPSWLAPSTIPHAEKRVIGSVIRFLPDHPSTNLWAMEELSAGAEEGLVLVTDHQTKGRGQQGTRWESEKGKNLTFSVVLRAKGLESQLFDLSKAIGLAMQKALSALLPRANVQIKWPNDLLIDQKKVAGILIESQWEGSRLKGTVVGIGLNVNQTQFMPVIAPRTTSLAREAGKPFDRRGVWMCLLDHLEEGYRTFQTEGRGSLARQYLSVLYGYQEPVQIRWQGGAGKYPILGVNEQGHLAIQLPEGIRHFDLKEVEFVWE